MLSVEAVQVELKPSHSINRSIIIKLNQVDLQIMLLDIDFHDIYTQRCLLCCHCICYVNENLSLSVSLGLSRSRRSLITLKGRYAVWPYVPWPGWWRMFAC